MARSEVYELQIDDHSYDERVQLVRIDIGVKRVEVEYEDGHKAVYYTVAEVLKRQKAAQKSETSSEAASGKKSVRRRRFSR